jgi:hypothetical protein
MTAKAVKYCTKKNKKQNKPKDEDTTHMPTQQR